ncbi:MAG: ABC-type transport auxiliary lipoprotein family protein [Verrucomicrobiota bacterium]
MFGFAVLLLTGCHILPAPQADPAHFYTLGGKAAEAPAPSPASTLRLGLRPVELPVYLQNRALVVRPGGSEIRYQQNHRWAEPLDEAVARVVRTRLLAAPTVATVYPTPFPVGEPRDYDVTVRVLRCEGERRPDGHATAQFTAVIEIARTAGPALEIVARKTFTAPAAWDGNDFAALAAALGDAAAGLGQEIAAALPAAR